ncbi:MAG TPA: ABC transporter permease [Terriglobia bacterium]|nr:ABC transporter permease [Terriglobia bacterium]
MNFREAIVIALRSLRENRLRSFLTLLGVVIGVMTVVTVVSFISGLNVYVSEKIFTLGPDVFVISRTPLVTVSFEDWVESQKRRNLDMADADAIRQACRDCVSVGVTSNATTIVKRGREYLEDSQIQGNTHDVMDILGTTIESGRGLSAHDVSHSRQVAVIGADVAETLFPFVDPLGKELTVNDRPFEIIGVGEKQGAVIGQSRDNWVVIPITVFNKMWGSRRSVRIYAKADGTGRLEAAEDEARQILRARRHVAYQDEDDFEIDTNANFLALWANISQTFFAVTVAIASISLVVGGIVVMNIMLVSVTERTREIGVRKAIGARRQDILIQFLIESATLSLVGGVIGILFGITVAVTVSRATSMPASIQWWAIALAIVVSTGVGLFFGIYPATRAARMDPITALRHE